MRRAMTYVGVLLALATTAAGCSEPAKTASTTERTTPTSGSASSCDASDLLGCARRSTLKDFVPAKPLKAAGNPIKLGMINQENSPAGSFPELSAATRAAIKFVNQELGGVDGRPIELEVCNTNFSAEGSTSCGQKFVEAGVPAVLGGIDVFGNAIDTLRDNKIPYVGGIPVSFQSVRSTNSFQWSGGTWGATVAFADYAARGLKAKKVAIVYGEFGSITESAEYGKRVLAAAGVEAQLVPYPILATDISSALNAAVSGQPDALIILAADTGCKPAFEGLHALDSKAKAFYVGACAAPTIIDGIDPAASEGAYFNVEGPIDPARPDIDTLLYTQAVLKYGRGLDPIGAGTVSFRSFMNLYVVLRELGADDINPASITEALSAKRDAPSFMGHRYTCDRKQFEGLPAMCSPQEILGVMKDGALQQVGDWIDVGKIYAG